jgi:hypothetical protein
VPASFRPRNALSEVHPGSADIGLRAHG